VLQLLTTQIGDAELPPQVPTPLAILVVQSLPQLPQFASVVKPPEASLKVSSVSPSQSLSLKSHDLDLGLGSLAEARPARPHRW
jgi:hypothetical protein